MHDWLQITWRALGIGFAKLPRSSQDQLLGGRLRVHLCIFARAEVPAFESAGFQLSSDPPYVYKPPTPPTLPRPSPVVAKAGAEAKAEAKAASTTPEQGPKREPPEKARSKAEEVRSSAKGSSKAAESPEQSHDPPAAWAEAKDSERQSSSQQRQEGIGESNSINTSGNDRPSSANA